MTLKAVAVVPTTSATPSGPAGGDLTGTYPNPTIVVGAVTDAKSSLMVKPAVALVSTTNLALTGEQTIDGVLTVGSLVLLTGQSTGSQNGPWVSAAGAWARPAWFVSGSTTQAPQFCWTLVRLGTLYQGSIWRMTTAAVTIDTTAQTWTQTPLVVGATSIANGVTGTGAVVLATSPTLATPVLGVATATSVTLPLNTTASVVRLGTGGMELQSYSLNNSFILDNSYFDGSGFVNRATGPSGLFYFLGTEGQYRFFPSVTAGTNNGNGTAQLKILSTGVFAVGPSISATTGSTSGAVFTVSATGLLTTGAITAQGVVNLNVSANNATNIGTGTTSSTVSIGGGSNSIALGSPTTLTLSQSASTNITVSNVNGGTAATAGFAANNDGGTGYAQLVAVGTAFTTNGAYVADSAVMESGAGMAGGMSILSRVAPIRMYSGGLSTLVATWSATALTLPAYDIALDTTTGTKVGTATSQKLAFHNATPVVQRVGAAQTAVVTTASTNVTPFGFATAAQADAIVTLVNEIRATLVEKGLIKGAA